MIPVSSSSESILKNFCTPPNQGVYEVNVSQLNQLRKVAEQAELYHAQEELKTVNALLKTLRSQQGKTKSIMPTRRSHRTQEILNALLKTLRSQQGKTKSITQITEEAVRRGARWRAHSIACLIRSKLVLHAHQENKCSDPEVCRLTNAIREFQPFKDRWSIERCMQKKRSKDSTRARKCTTLIASDTSTESGSETEVEIESSESDSDSSETTTPQRRKPWRNDNAVENEKLLNSALEILGKNPVKKNSMYSIAEQVVASNPETNLTAVAVKSRIKRALITHSHEEGSICHYPKICDLANKIRKYSPYKERWSREICRVRREKQRRRCAKQYENARKKKRQKIEAGPALAKNGPSNSPSASISAREDDVAHTLVNQLAARQEAPS